ncbi:integrase catalytic domain-containing protein [Trichonephila clavipes]|nr:integrase catalytic domain-containing protein [Trichonephila clavipes]
MVAEWSRYRIVAGLVNNSSSVPLKTHRVGERCSLNLSRAQTSSRWCATIRHHIEKYKHEFPHTVELLDRNFYVDDLISGGNEFEEALLASRRAKNIMEAAGINLRKWITNDVNLMKQWKKENFNVHPVHETVSLGANGTKVLGLSWNTNEDYLTTDTKSLLEFVSLDKNTKRFILQAVGKIFDPLGLISPFTVRMQCLLQDLWKEEIQWDDPLPTHIEKE